jgi:hypothetical protein
MKITINIHGTKHDIVLPDGVTAPHLSHPFNYVVKHQAMVEKYISIIYDMAKALPKHKDVTDLFGGIGLFPKTMWDLLQPKSWTCIEVDPQLEQCFQEPRAKFVVGNAYLNPKLTDIVFIDAFDGTLRTIATNKDARLGLYYAIRDQRPEDVIVTDFGYYWVHLPNHHPWYELQFGVKPTKANYHELWDKWWQANIGYKLVRHEHGVGSGYYHMKPC